MCGVEQVEPTVALHVEHEVVLSGLLLRQIATDLQPGGVEQDIDAAVAFADVGHRGADGIGIGEVDRVVVHRAAGRLDRLDGGECGIEPLESSEFTFDRHGCRVITGGLHPFGDGDLQSVAVVSEGREIGVVPVGRRREIEQVERAGGRHRQVGGDRRHDAAGGAGDHHDRVRTELDRFTGTRFGIVAALRERRLDECHAEALIVDTADLDTAGVEQGLLDQLRGDRLGLATLGEVDRLDERVGTLLLVRLGESDDRPAERVGRAGFVVAVVAAEPGRRDQERARAVQVAHGRVERLDPSTQRLAPAIEVVVGEFTIGVERREPVDAGDRRLLVPRIELGEEIVRAHTRRQGEDGCAGLGELLLERLADTSFVEHHDDSSTGQVDAGRHAVLDARVAATAPARGSGSASTASKSPWTTAGACAAAGVAAGAEPADAGRSSPARSRTQAATWFSVGKSRNCKLSSRSTS